MVTSLPDPEAQKLQIIVGCAISISLILFLALCVAFYAWKQKSQRIKTDRIARNVMVWSKRVMISMDTNNNGNNEESGEVVPNVKIEKFRATPTRYF